jgi:hypothetical protein
MMSMMMIVMMMITLACLSIHDGSGVEAVDEVHHESLHGAIVERPLTGL